MSTFQTVTWPRLAIAAALLAASVSSQAANLFVNGSFETGTFSGWTSSGGATVTNTQQHTGSFAFSGSAGGNIIQTFAAIDTDEITELSFWGKRSGGLFDLVVLSYSDLTSENVYVNTLGKGNDWTFVNLTSQLDDDKSLVSFQIYGTSPGPAYLDDFVLSGEVHTPAVPEPETCALMALGLVGMGLFARKRKA